MNPDEKRGAAKRVLAPLDRLRPGWVVDRDLWWKDQRLVATGVKVTESIINGLRRRGFTQVEVQADSELADYAARPVDHDPVIELLARSEEVYAAHGVEQAIPQEVIEEASGQIEGFFAQIVQGQPVDLDTIRPTIRKLIQSFTARSHLAVKLLDLDRFDRYTYRHSVNVGLLFLLVGREWAANERALEELVFGALLHDLGKAKVGAAIINKQGPLDDAEWAVMRQHTIWSEELLKQAGGEPAALAIARSHHERVDGSGYPDGLRGTGINKHARLAAICDVYDALTSRRSYKQRMGFAQAVDIIIQESGTHFDPELVHLFISRIGRYPLGSFVMLSTNEIAVVVRENENAVSRPVVSVVLSSDGSRVEDAQELDLGQHGDIFIGGLIGSMEGMKPKPAGK